MTDVGNLNAIEQAALLPLVEEWYHRPRDDRDTALVAMLRLDGAAVLVKLTVERVPSWAARYWQTRVSEHHSAPADD